jgi:hypothetical protein
VGKVKDALNDAKEIVKEVRQAQKVVKNSKLIEITTNK